MKTVTLIPNPIAPNLEAFGAHLVLACGCTATDQPLTFVCPDAGADEMLANGVARLASDVPTFDAERAWLKAYSGSFDFYLSLKAQLAKKGKLSEKQWAAITKAIARDQAEAAKQVAVASGAAPTFTLAPGTEIVVKKFAGATIAHLAGCSRPHFGFLVLEVLKETQKAYLVRLRMAAVRSSSCCVCGLRLTNPASIELGIGPICGDHWGVDKSPAALEQLAEKLRVYSEVETWLAKSAIKERKENHGKA